MIERRELKRMRLSLAMCVLCLFAVCVHAADGADFDELARYKSRDEGVVNQVRVNDPDVETRIHVEITDLDVSYREIGTAVYTVVEIPGMPLTMAEGLPMLPRIPQMIQISDTLVPEVTVEPLSVRLIPLAYPLIPAQDDCEIEDIVAIESDRESLLIENTVYPPNALLVSEPMIMRDVRTIIVSYHPVRYRVKDRCLEVVEEAEIVVRYRPGPAVNTITQRGPYSRTFDHLYRAMITNYRDPWPEDAQRDAAEVYLMVMPRAFESRCQGFITWKEDQGFQVEIIRLEELTSPTAANVWQAIQLMYNSEHRPVYVCIVGNTNNFPVYESYDNYHPPADPFDDDYYYQLLDGADLLPETFQSRLPARNVTELTTMLSKILWYEQTPQTSNSAFYKTALMAAADNYESQITVKEQTADRLDVNLGYSTIHTMYDWNWSSEQEIMDWVEQGVSIINYRGEGWYTGWSPSGGSFSYSDVESINNTNLLPVITSIGCGVGMFDGSSASFSHSWMTMGTPTNHMGAVAFMGPTFNTRTIINNWIDRGIYRGFCYHDITRSADVFAYGKLYAYDYLYDYNDPQYGVEGIREHLNVHLREYVLQGTPDLWWRTDVPRGGEVHTAWTPGSDRDGIVVIDDEGNRVANCQLNFIKGSEHRVYVTDGGGGCKVFMRDVSSPIPVTVSGWNLIPFRTSYLPQLEGDDGDILITEFKPDIETTGSAGDKVELYNNDTGAVNLAGWTIGDLDGYDIPFVSQAAVVQAGDIAVVVLVGYDGVESVTPTSYGLLIHSRAQPGLSAVEDTIVLRNTEGRVRDSICYHNGTGIGSTDAAYDMSKLTQPTTPLSMGSGGWWTGPDEVPREQYESLVVNWSAYAGIGGQGSIKRVSIPPAGAYDRPDYFMVTAIEGFGEYVPSERDHVVHGVIRE
ncbi:lamin tail domain-containing protein [bacterium]|nr:lamin tail domain-containing protein [candidate division CSSED10-310 bacterium]